MVTNVYGPSQDNLKEQFIDELRVLAENIHYPWILAGDFNIVRWLIDRSADMRGFSLMCRFNQLISDLQLIDVPMKNREYTWSCKRPAPVFSRIDRIFLSPEWSLRFPVITMDALEMTVSDHVPPLLICKYNQSRPAPFRLETFWFHYPQVKDRVRQIWQGHSLTMLKNFHEKSVRLHHSLREWHQRDFGRMDSQLEFCKKVITFFDRIEEKRKLDTREFRLRIKVRQRAYLLANLLEIQWQQRSRCYLKGLLGIETDVMGFHPKILCPVATGLSSLTEPITELALQSMIKLLAINKASGPNGFPMNLQNGASLS